MLSDKGDVPDDPDFTLPLGVANVERGGRRRHDPELRAPAGPRGAARGAGAGHDHGIDAELIDLRTAPPADLQTIVASVKKTNPLRHCGRGLGLLRDGIGDPVPSTSRAFDYLDAPIEYVHSDEDPVPTTHYLEEAMSPAWTGSSGGEGKCVTGREWAVGRANVEDRDGG